MKMAIAVECNKHPRNQNDYKVWFLEIDRIGNVVGINVTNKSSLVEDLFKSYRENGTSNWKAFLKEKDAPISIEIYDFISRNMYENTHFGNLPTLNEFQKTLEELQSRVNIRPIAS